MGESSVFLQDTVSPKYLDFLEANALFEINKIHWIIINTGEDLILYRLLEPDFLSLHINA